MKIYLQEVVRKGSLAAKSNIIPTIVLQLLALSLVIIYYNVDSFKEALDWLGEYNTKWAPWFAIIMTMFFGGAIPLMIEAYKASKQGGQQKTIAQTLFTLALWGLNGFIVVWFYKLQSSLFGEDLSFITVFKKVCVDQFLYVPLYVVPVFTFLFLWRDLHFSLTKTRQALEHKGFFRRAIPLMITNWCVWIPAVSVIYLFPLALQLILMNLILVFWSLILSFFIKD